MRIVAVGLLTFVSILGNGCAGTPSADPVATSQKIARLVTQAEAGDYVAQNDLASHYQAGDGVPQDYAKAFVLYQKAAVSGAALPECNLGFMYDLGLGTTQNRTLANVWYLKSAEQGYAPAMLNLGLNIADGVGSPPDVIEAMKWLDLARYLTQNDGDMQVKWRIRGAYDELKARLTSTQLAEAQQRSAVWLEKFKNR